VFPTPKRTPTALLTQPGHVSDDYHKNAMETTTHPLAPESPYPPHRADRGVAASGRVSPRRGAGPIVRRGGPTVLMPSGLNVAAPRPDACRAQAQPAERRLGGNPDLLVGLAQKEGACDRSPSTNASLAKTAGGQTRRATPRPTPGCAVCPGACGCPASPAAGRTARPSDLPGRCHCRYG
jgi:hypothetical protein